MFKRIKNLLDISRYSVDDFEMRVRPGETMDKYYERTWGPTEVTSTDPNFEYKIDYVPNPAKVINMKAEDPFKELYDTPEQSPDDSTSRNG